jgi:hypothetical protein
VCKSFENVTKICSKEYDEEGINLNTNTSRHGNNNQFMTVNTSNLKGMPSKHKRPIRQNR